jgi:hypothetical protein
MMLRRERDDLEKLCRDRERLSKAAADARAAEMKANFEEQIAAIYSFDQDAVWKTAHEQIAQVGREVQATVAARCKELGILPEFAPTISFDWYGRGQNAAKGRRDELRKVAYTRIDAKAKEAKTRITLVACDYRSRLVSGSLESDEAKAFLESMPTVADMMPQITVAQIQDEMAKAKAERPSWMLG